MKSGKMMISLAALVSIASLVSCADLGHAGNQADAFREDDSDLMEKAYNLLLDNGIDEEAAGEVLAASWFSKAFDTVKHYANKGCHYVNQVPFKEFVDLGKEELRSRGINEEQFVAGALGALHGAKAACGALGK